MATNQSYTDMELLQRVANYDSKALEALYNRYSPIIFTLVKKIVPDPALAEEVLMEIFVIIWRKVNYFDFKSGSPYTWLITLARNKALDTVKRRANPTDFEEYSDAYEDFYIVPQLSQSIDVLDLQTALEVRGKVEKALNQLTDAQQYVIYLGYYEGLDESEIAERLKIPVQTVKSKLKLALTNLKDNLIKGEA